MTGPLPGLSHRMSCGGLDRACIAAAVLGVPRGDESCHQAAQCDGAAICNSLETRLCHIQSSRFCDLVLLWLWLLRGSDVVSQLDACWKSVPAFNTLPHTLAPGHLLDEPFFDALACPELSSIMEGEDLQQPPSSAPPLSLLG